MLVVVDVVLCRIMCTCAAASPDPPDDRTLWAFQFKEEDEKYELRKQAERAARNQHIRSGSPARSNRIVSVTGTSVSSDALRSPRKAWNFTLSDDF